MNNRTILSVTLSLSWAFALDAAAQTTNEVAPEPFYRVVTTIPDVIPSADGAIEDLKLEYFVDAAGSISGVAVLDIVAASAVQSSACRPACFVTADRPPRTICLIMAGCGGLGGGGTLSIAKPILVDFQLVPDAARNAEGVFNYDINVFDFGETGQSKALDSEVRIPTGQ